MVHIRIPSQILIVILWLAGLGAAAQFAKISVIFPSIRAVYPDAGASLGFLVSLISLLGIALGLFAGLIAARIGFRRLIIAALLFGAAMSAYQATLPALEWMLAARALEGMSHLVIVVVAPTLIAQVSSDRMRPFAMSLWSTFFGVSFALVAFLGLPLVARYGVEALFLAHGLYLIVIAGVLFVVLPRVPVGAPTTSLGLRDVARAHLEIYRSPSIAAPALGWLFYTLTFVSLLTILPEIVAPEDRSFVIGTMPLAGIVVSLTLGVTLVRFFEAVYVVILGFALAALILLGFVLAPGSPVLCIALLGALGLVQGASFVAIPQLNAAPEDQSKANGAMAQMGNLGNTCGTPLLLSVMSLLGQSGLILFAIMCYALGIAVHLILARRRALLAK